MKTSGLGRRSCRAEPSKLKRVEIAPRGKHPAGSLGAQQQEDQRREWTSCDDGFHEQFVELDKFHTANYLHSLTSLLHGNGQGGSGSQGGELNTPLALEDGQADAAGVVEEFESVNKLKEARTGKPLVQGARGHKAGAQSG